MNAHQHRQRLAFWRGSFSVILGVVVLVLALMLADRTGQVAPKELNSENLTRPPAHSQAPDHKPAAQTIAAHQ